MWHCVVLDQIRGLGLGITPRMNKDIVYDTPLSRWSNSDSEGGTFGLDPPARGGTTNRKEHVAAWSQQLRADH
jgi:hypothetical protein